MKSHGPHRVDLSHELLTFPFPSIVIARFPVARHFQYWHQFHHKIAKNKRSVKLRFQSRGQITQNSWLQINNQKHNNFN